jgi:hypothetical protein
MGWRRTEDPGRFLDEAGPYLSTDPAAHAPLLTEADFWRRRPERVAGGRAAWWNADGRVGGAWVHLPDHPPLCSVLDPVSVDGLMDVLGDEPVLAVHVRDAARVAEAWRARGAHVRVASRIAVLRLGIPIPRPEPAGAARVAVEADRALLHAWFAEFRARTPEDPSDAAYVVDVPLEDGSVLLWEVDGEPVAMASRTPVVAGVTRLGLAFQPSPGTELADAAFRAACKTADQRAEHVVALSGTPEATAELVALGFLATAERVLLAR